MHKIFIFLTYFACFILAACAPGEEKVPPEKMALEAAKNNAQKDVFSGVETRNFIRQNGWVDTASSNIYKVQFNYEMALIKDFSIVLLDLAKSVESEQQRNDKNSGFMGINSWGNLFQLQVDGNNWINGQENFIKRRDNILNECKPCMDYWNNEGGNKDAAGLRRYSFIKAWSHLQVMGFKDEQKAGDAVTWNTTPSFMKTEKGWMPTN